MNRKRQIRKLQEGVGLRKKSKLTKLYEKVTKEARKRVLGEQKEATFSRDGFKVGDTVKVAVGKHSGRRGKIINISPDWLRLRLDDGTVEEFDDSEVKKESTKGSYSEDMFDKAKLINIRDGLARGLYRKSYKDLTAVQKKEVDDTIKRNTEESLKKEGRFDTPEDSRKDAQAINLYGKSYDELDSSTQRKIDTWYQKTYEKVEEGYADKSDALAHAKQLKRQGKSLADIERRMAGEFRDPDDVDWIIANLERVDNKKLNKLYEKVCEEAFNPAELLRIHQGLIRLANDLFDEKKDKLARDLVQASRLVKDVINKH